MLFYIFIPCFPVIRRGDTGFFFKYSGGMAVIIHIAGAKCLRNGKVGIPQHLLQFADFIIQIILMRCNTDMLFKQL